MLGAARVPVEVIVYGFLERHDGRPVTAGLGAVQGFSQGHDGGRDARVITVRGVRRVGVVRQRDG